MAAQLCKSLVVCETLYRDTYYENLLGSIVRVGYCISVPDFYLVLHSLGHRKRTIMDKPTNKY